MIPILSESCTVFWHLKNCICWSGIYNTLKPFRFVSVCDSVTVLTHCSAFFYTSSLWYEGCRPERTSAKFDCRPLKYGNKFINILFDHTVTWRNWTVRTVSVAGCPSPWLQHQIRNVPFTQRASVWRAVWERQFWIITCK